MIMVELQQVSRRYGAVQALAPIDLQVRKGEFVTLLGPSGSGKTTLLNLIAGTVAPSTGRVLIRGEDVTHSPPSRRELGMVFQNYALMPHMTVFENIAFPLRVRRLPKPEIERKVREVLELIRLPDVAQRRPRELSGGQQQRVSLARCIVYNPALILLDEPLGALDKKLREHMQLEIRSLHAELGVTMLNVTHDQDEALTMSDRIVLMNEGRIEQQATPAQLYSAPVSVFAADFLGTANLIAGEVSEQSDGWVTLATQVGPLRARVPAAGASPGTRATLVVRPEAIDVVRGDTLPLADQVAVEGTLRDLIVLGSVLRYHVRTAGGQDFVAQQQNHRRHADMQRGMPVRLIWAAEDGQLLA
ncbi:ABC transporter ATP-binding protein [Bordetella sp. BOR01]|uniref:ABC transporter ATP-binding protein n=1 Tax=Bordetella sp. BOR01 TaxID=2854779 RepID=UPI001C4537D5|nr:ABC transporter ATP-binding protein [Bordetella sp. BOR01]MBV7485315.1 ABC transporter ATP-binding protein [Bordetella sp. BOR01]